MRGKLFLVFALSLALFSVSVKAAGAFVPYGQDETNPICTGDIAVEAEDLLNEAGREPTEWDYTSYYFRTQTGDSVGLFVNEGDATDPWTFTSWAGNTFQNRRTTACGGSTGKNFVALLDRYLILSDATGFYVCGCYHAEGARPAPSLVTLAPPTTGYAFPYERFLPYYVYREYTSNTIQLYVLISNATHSNIYVYDLADTAATLPATLDGGQTTLAISSIFGIRELVYVPGSGIRRVSDWTEDTSVTVPAEINVPSAYPLRGGRSLLVLQSADGLQGRVLLLQPTGVTNTGFGVGSLPSYETTTPYQIYADGLTSLVIHGQFGIWWMMYFDETQETDSLTLIPSDLQEAIQGQIQYISLSGDKMVLFTDSNIYYLKNTEDDIREVYSTAIEDVDGLDLSGDAEYRLAFNCLCASVKKFICMSSTLNCIIIQKVDDACHTEDSIIPESV